MKHARVRDQRGKSSQQDAEQNNQVTSSKAEPTQKKSWTSVCYSFLLSLSSDDGDGSGTDASDDANVGGDQAGSSSSSVASSRGAAPFGSSAACCPRW